ncbi:MAG: tRNA (5-methylaminomethyl-2-thiouridine)(34)-methyltransferase MnmD [Nitrospinota bacterium]
MFKPVKTKDGSYTFHSSSFDEHYHSITAGGIQEAKKKFVEPAEIKKGARILDFCFGLGYNTLAAIYDQPDLDITGIENDKNILREIFSLEVPPGYRSSFEAVRLAAEQAESGTVYTKGALSIQLTIEDGKEAIKRFAADFFDAIFFDPFSPAKHPAMWSANIFQEMYRVLKPEGRLTTYSCARKVRENMTEAGFFVLDGPVLGRRGPSTVAIKKSRKEIP